jgi:hypothetical protein
MVNADPSVPGLDQDHLGNTRQDPAPAASVTKDTPSKPKLCSLLKTEEKADVQAIENWSGRRDLNPRQLAWEARTLPLSYARSRLSFIQEPYWGVQSGH